ncbi:cupin domain-containing protein [Kitasatospora sp. NA04385]|uniref:cupin domain-containing protein n=1 Tax=Kitasatospora sp. NA04385 TaxID=2742135 RepID=UPI0015923D1F|nr:cupin domain-containing protein [Kitasatospora sp. NA04385]QKW23636.1 cupin domain-containing protein [Kitasatospora sp. NA04385]
MSSRSIKDIVVFGESEGEVRHVRKGPDRWIAGELAITNTLQFASPDGAFTAGIWESTPGKFRAVYEEDEFYHMLYGQVVIADEDGNARTFHPGDTIVVPAGFTGTWEVVEPTKKFYAHYRPGSGPALATATPVTTEPAERTDADPSDPSDPSVQAG